MKKTKFRPRPIPADDEPAAPPPAAKSAPTGEDDVSPGCLGELTDWPLAEPKAVPDPIKSLLAERGLSIDILAQKAGVSERTVYRWVKEGTMLQRATRRAIARVLGTDEFEIRRLSIHQRRYAEFGRLNLNLLRATCVCMHAGRLTDDELRESGVSAEQLGQIIEQFQLLRKRVASLGPPRRKRNRMRPPPIPPGAAADDGDLPAAG